MPKPSKPTSYYDLVQTKTRIHRSVQEAIQADAGVMGHRAIGSILRFGLACWLAIPAPTRRAMLTPWPSTASDAWITAYLNDLWPIRLIRAAARLSHAEREALLEELEQE